MKDSFKALTDTFTAPTQAFALVRERRATSWLPLILVVLCTVAVSTWYFSTADIERMLAEDAAISGESISEEEAEQMAAFMPFTGLFSLLFIPLVYALIALYLHMVAATATEAELKYGRWFAMTSYAFLPTLISLLTIALSYWMSGDAYIGYEKLDMTSFNNLILHWPADNPWVGIINSLNLTNLWAYALLAVGYKTLTQGGWGGAIATVAIPTALIYGVWAGIVLVVG